jgi:hypothetical protein
MRGALLCIVPFLVLAGCDQGYDGVWSDAVTDTVSEPGGDVVAEVEDDTPCTYPEGPYHFWGAGDIVGPMYWPTAIRGVDERTTTPSFEDWHCDPEIKSIFLHAAAAT